MHSLSSEHMCAVSLGNIPDEINVVPKRTYFRTPHARAKFCAKPALIQLSTFDTTQTDGKEMADSAVISLVSF